VASSKNESEMHSSTCQNTRTTITRALKQVKAVERNRGRFLFKQPTMRFCASGLTITQNLVPPEIKFGSSQLKKNFFAEEHLNR
jgi:hypothetical protein